MLSPEQYAQFEQQQSNRQQFATPTPSMLNHERWQITRYNNNPRRYFVTAREELGTQFKQYVDRSYWQGGSEQNNRMFEELQYFYRNTLGLKITRTTVNSNCQLFEVTQQHKPLQMIMQLDSQVVYAGDVSPLKDGYRYRMSRV
jgi:hypothetical protein